MKVFQYILLIVLCPVIIKAEEKPFSVLDTIDGVVIYEFKKIAESFCLNDVKLLYGDNEFYFFDNRSANYDFIRKYKVLEQYLGNPSNYACNTFSYLDIDSVYDLSATSFYHYKYGDEVFLQGKRFYNRKNDSTLIFIAFSFYGIVAFYNLPFSTDVNNEENICCREPHIGNGFAVLLKALKLYSLTNDKEKALDLNIIQSDQFPILFCE